jgi:hypothetical protein
MSSAPTPEEIARDATWLAQALDPSAGMARLVAMNRESYRSASFLDDRLLQHPVDAQVVPWSDVEAAVEGTLRTDARWIFHIGHVGSTLISRLIGEIDGVLAIREPRLLRDLAVSAPDVRRPYIEAVPKLMSRTFDPNEIVCVKATSFASEIAPLVVPRGKRALFMFARPRNYVASILAGENSLKELRQLTEFRIQRLASRGIELPRPGTDAERAATAWAAEMATLETSAEAMPDRLIEWADFDVLLTDMPSGLGQIASFFGFGVNQVAALAGGPLMQRYSKALEYEYSPGLREELIAGSDRRHRDEIDGALAMLRSAAESSPIIARSMGRAEG